MGIEYKGRSLRATLAAGVWDWSEPGEKPPGMGPGAWGLGRDAETREVPGPEKEQGSQLCMHHVREATWERSAGYREGTQGTEEHGVLSRN